MSWCPVKNLIPFFVFIYLRREIVLDIQVFLQKKLELFCKKGVFRNLSNFRGKPLCWRLFLIKLWALKKDSNACFFLWNLADFKERLFWRTSANDFFCFWITFYQFSREQTLANGLFCVLHFLILRKLLLLYIIQIIYKSYKLCIIIANFWVV